MAPIAAASSAPTTLYSFQDITGGGSVTFARPVKESALFVVFCDAPSRQIAIRRLAHDAFDLASGARDGFASTQLAGAGTPRAALSGP